MTNAVNEAIARAREAAANVVDAEVIGGSVPSTEVIPTTVAPPANFQKPSMDLLGSASGGIAKSVSEWLKVSKFGLTIGSDQKILETLDVTIDMNEGVGFFTKYSIKFGNPAQYYSSYDGVTCDRGGTWADALMKVQRIDPNQQTFPAADIIMTLAEDVALKGKTVPAGTKMGHTTSMSNFGNWAEFYRECAQKGLLGTEVKVKLGFEAVTSKKNGNTWGVITFHLAE